MTFDEALDQFTGLLTIGGFSPHTMRYYGRAARVFWRHAGLSLVGLESLALTPAIILPAIAAIGRAHPVDTSRVYLAGIRRFLRFLRSHGCAVTGRIPKLRGARRARSLPRCLTHRDLTALLSLARKRATTPKGIRTWAIIEMLYASGMRISELLGLTLADIADPGAPIPVIGKGRKMRHIFLGQPAQEALACYLTVRRGLATGKSPLFCKSDGQPLPAWPVRWAIQKLADEAGIPHVTPHMFRHTFATDLLNAGVDLRFVQEFLGHADINTTQRYTWVATAELQRVYEAGHPRARAPQANVLAWPESQPLFRVEKSA